MATTDSVEMLVARLESLGYQVELRIRRGRRVREDERYRAIAWNREGFIEGIKSDRGHLEALLALARQLRC
jgi:hypothetical protein